MRFIQNLSVETISLLKRVYQQSQHHLVRQRAQCILLSHEGYSTTTLMDVFKVTRLTIYNWFNEWEERGFAGLYDRPGRGRKRTLTPEQAEQVKQWVKANPKNLEAVRTQIKEAWDIVVSKATIKRVLKALGMSWRRIRRQVGGNPDPTEYQQKKDELESLKQAEKQGDIDLRYLDETGFCLISNVPYGWQSIGIEEIFINSQQSKRLNVLGLMNRANELDTYVFEESITSDVVIACVDDFTKTLQKPTVLVIDNASIHTSQKFEAKIDDWKGKDLEIFRLPTYSPQLNLIEILWRFIKYEWVELEAYRSWESLVDYVERVLIGFGSEYIINFA